MWRPATKQLTGTNDVPLGNRRRFGPAPGENSYEQPILAQPSPSAFPRQQDTPAKRSRDESSESPGPQMDPNAPRKRRSRWGEAKADIPGLPHAVSADGVSQAQLDNYAIQLRLEEINTKLRSGMFIPAEHERSPSPPPTYDAQGRRTNTREVRYRKKLEEERVRLVDRAMKTDPNFRPPADYHQAKRSHRPQDKVYIPVKEFPEINFFGLLVGPRGNSLKKMERESGAKISIRGKGSVKEGKNRPEQFAEDAEEDLHCLVMAETEEKVVACVNMINRVIETAASTPEGQNDHKRNQLRELAALNGTLRDDENQICQNCGGVGHRKYDCPEQKNFTANIICRICGSAGHMARDCTQRSDVPQFSGMQGSPPPPGGAMVKGGSGGFDSEYANLMAELGETAGGSGAKGWGGAGGEFGGGSNIPPWRRPEMWQSSTPATGQAYRPPQGDQGYGGQYGGQGYGYGGQGHGMQGGGYGGQPGYGNPQGGSLWEQAGYSNPQQQQGYGQYYQQYAQQA